MTRNLFYCAYLFLFICVIHLIIAWPNRFQKWNSIKPTVCTQCVFRQIQANNALDVSFFIKSIPYQGSPKFVYSVLPSTKYRKTIIEGHGDCSNLSFGAAYYLLERKIDFDIIHFLPPESFLKACGHVALRVPYNLNNTKRIGVVDLAEGGIPHNNGIFLDIGDLGNDATCISILTLTELKDSSSRYYVGEYLDRLFIGWTPANEVQRYYDFIEAAYISFGNEKVEKYFFDGLALLLGYYYRIYVHPAFFQANGFQRLFFIFALWFVRVTIILLPIVISYEFWRRKRRKANSISQSAGEMG